MMTTAGADCLRPPILKPLPLGAIRPEGWLKDQLLIQADGLTGHLDEFWPSVAESAWKGGGGDHWERGPYYLDGLVPLAYITGQPRLLAKVREWIEPILASAQPSGWFGPASNQDRWPLSVAMKALTQYHDATGDERVLPLLKNYFAYLSTSPPDWPASDWRGVRAMETAIAAHWLYERAADHRLLDVVRTIRDSSFDWTGYWLRFPHGEPATREGFQFRHSTHVVNVAMGIRYPGVWYRQSGDPRDREAVFEAMAVLDRHHGQAGGWFSGDEHLAGRRPTAGTELCAIVEYMYSLETLLAIFGEAALADRLEMLAYNGLPATCTPDGWAHQYDQQVNQVLCTVAKRAWTNNGDESNIFGLEPNFGCCTANLHQGWPKFVSHLWMATADGGLAATAFGPCQVTHPVPGGGQVCIDEITEYPFDGRIRFRIEPASRRRFPLHVRIPAWADGAVIQVGGDAGPVQPGRFAVIDREWRPGDEVVLDLPMTLWTERRYNDALSVFRGPLLFGLRIGERFRKLRVHHVSLPAADWEIEPTTPWNYGLLMNEQASGQSFRVERRAVGPVPFASETPPVVLRARARLIPPWRIEKNSAGDTPLSPVRSAEPVTDVELVPYGSTRLRIAEFPTVE